MPVGQESAQLRLQRTRPVEQAPGKAPIGNKPKPSEQGEMGQSLAELNDRRQQARQAVQAKLDEKQLEQLKQLAARDREVRAHEQAHKAVAGSYAGAITYEYEKGPDGNRYAVAGEVAIDTAPESSPEATLIKARIIQQAANAPAEPSEQDRAVAAHAAQMEQEALQLLAQQRHSSDTRANAQGESGGHGVDALDSGIPSAVKADQIAEPAGQKPSKSLGLEPAQAGSFAAKKRDHYGQPLVSLHFHVQA
jgi:hypothetical protein